MSISFGQKYVNSGRLPFLFTPFAATYAQKLQNSDFAHVCLGFITRKQRENTSRRQRMNSNSLPAYSQLRFSAVVQSCLFPSTPHRLRFFQTCTDSLIVCVADGGMTGSLKNTFRTPPARFHRKVQPLHMVLYARHCRGSSLYTVRFS